MYLIRDKDKKIKRRNIKKDPYTKQIFVFLFLSKNISDRASIKIFQHARLVYLLTLLRGYSRT